MRAGNSHVPNGEVDGPSLAFHLVRFCASSFFAFLPAATIWKVSVAIRGSTGSLGRLGEQLCKGERTERSHY
jgi:hypothetical protein